MMIISLPLLYYNHHTNNNNNNNRICLAGPHSEHCSLSQLRKHLLISSKHSGTAENDWNITRAASICSVMQMVMLMMTVATEKLKDH